MTRDLADVDPDALRAPRDGSVREAAGAILDDVERRGDAAVLDRSEEFDGVRPDPLLVPEDEVAAAVDRIDDDLRAVLERVQDRIAGVQRALRPEMQVRIEPVEGVTLEVERRPLARVGCYVPGGRAAYPSTVLMTVVPARVAGVPEIVVATPPGPDGSVPEATLAAAKLAGADRVLRVGGVQAIAALAFGTETIPRADKVVGPGNAYVAAAKELLGGRVGVDLPAGPTEVVVLADGTADPAWVAADLLAQAEHDPAARALLVGLDADLAKAVEDRTRDADNVACLVAGDLDAAVDWIDRYAPEHLQLMVADPDQARDARAGTVFVGRFSSAVVGDYATGADHVLPTGGAARWTDGLDVTDLLRDHVVQSVTEEGFEAIADDAVALARTEGLDAHADALEVRR